MFENRWNETEALAFIQRHKAQNVNADLALRVYTSRLIGSEPDLVMHGGGNTSCKTLMIDVFGEEIEVLCVKGSGWDLVSIESQGLPAVRLKPLLQARELKSLEDEDMVNLQRANLMDQSAPNPSVETLLHAFLPHKFVDHTHATPFLALANLPDAEAVTRELFGSRLPVVPYVMPGFDLAKQASKIADENPEAEGLLLLQHGHFTWGQTSQSSYSRVIDHTNLVESWFADKRDKIQYSGCCVPKDQSRSVINFLKKALHSHATEPSQSFVLNWIRDQQITSDMDKLINNKVVDRGVATPDHVIRIKPKPLVLTQDLQFGGVEAINASIDAYIQDYKNYFNRWSALSESPKKMLDPLPKIAWIEGIGLVGIGNSMKEAKIITDLGVQNIRVATDGENSSGFLPVTGGELFNLEYWSLEQAKIAKQAPLPMQGKVTLVTGAGGTIGGAIVSAFAAAGAEVVAADVNKDVLDQKEFPSSVSKRLLDVTNEDHIEALVDKIVVEYGGIDVLVSNAGVAPQSPMLKMESGTLRDSFEVNFFAHFNLARAVGRLFVEQGCRGLMLFNVSKQAVNPGKGFGAYGLPKAALMFLVRQLALELGEHGIRVNGVNADRIRSGILDDLMIASRAKVRGVSVDEYMEGNLLKRRVEGQHVAEAFLNLALSSRTSGHIMTVDGGNIEAALR